MSQQIGEFISKISSSVETKSILSALDDLSESLGFVGSVYFTAGNIKSTDCRSGTIFSESLSDWKTAYYSEGDNKLDPLKNYAPVMPEVFFTGRDFLVDYPYLGDRDRAIINRAGDFGIRTGLAMSMPQLGTNKTTIWNFVSDCSRHELQNRYKRDGGILQLAAFSAYQQIQTQIKAVETPRLHLSPRETECLKWLSCGLRTGQIAEKMRIKPVTVDLHLRNARKRLNAKTREQALAIAICSGAILI